MTAIPLGWRDGPDTSRAGPGFGGPPQARRAPELVQSLGDDHLLAIAATGLGKGRNLAIPALLSWDGTVIAIDVKGELYRTTARDRRRLGPVHAIDPFGEQTRLGSAINPLSGLEPLDDGFADDIIALARLIDSEPAGEVRYGDPFWRNWGQSVIAATLAHVAADPDPARRTLGRMVELLTGDNVAYNLAVMLDTTKGPRWARDRIGGFLGITEVTRSGIESTFAEQVQGLASPSIQKVLGADTIDRVGLRKGARMTIYLIWPAEKLASHGAALRLILTTLVRCLTARRAPPLKPTLLLVDEAGQLGRVPALVSATTLGRAYGVRIGWFVQSYAQLEDAYPREHRTIAENCGLTVTLGGQKQFLQSRMLSEQVFGDISPEAMFAMTREQMAVRMPGERTEVLRKVDYLKDAMFAGRFDDNPLHASTLPRRGGKRAAAPAAAGAAL